MRKIPSLLWGRATLSLALACLPGIAAAQTSRAADCAAQSLAAAEAVKRRSSVALYYELKLALVDGRVYEWRADAQPRRVMSNATHVAVNASHGHAIDADNRAVRWAAGSDRTEILFEDVAYLASGESGMLAIRCDGSLWQRKAGARDWSRVADAAIHAWVGDSADYYIDPKGRLYAAGKAHRGQYGNGRLDEASGWVAVAEDAVSVYSHTGHAVYLRRDGAVLGTGGNRAGPLGAHGYGDKAVRWGVIFEGASRLGTGNRHSMAIRPDGSLWTWGSADGLQPKQVLSNVAAAIGGDTETLAILNNGTVWSWRVGTPPQKVSLPQ
jgi:alpha-tubulin suppressor-like RCC1 family protein